MFDGEVDKSYFGGQRKGKRGRGAASKVAVFGLLKRNGKVDMLPYRILKQQLCCLLFVNKLNLTALFIRIVTTVMICWT